MKWRLSARSAPKPHFHVRDEMMHWTLNIIAAVLLLGVVSCGSHRDSPSELAGQLLDLQNEQEIFEGYRASLGSRFGGESDEFRRRFEQEMKWENLRPQFIAIYTNTYSVAELRAFVDFHTSPAGQVRQERWKQTREKIRSLLEQKRSQLMKEAEESRTNGSTVPTGARGRAPAVP